MTIALYSPYVPKHFGGGEKYFFDVARILAEQTQVQIAIPHLQSQNTSEIRRKYEVFLGSSLAKIEFIDTPLGTSASFLEKLMWTRKFEVLYYLTDGSLFFSLAQRNILHIQFPLLVDKSSSLEQLKLKNWQVKNTNSVFTQNIVSRRWPVKIDEVHYPLVELADELATQPLIPKKKVILSVGRFFRQLHTKRQDILIELFRELCQREPERSRGWELVLIGSIEDEKYVDELCAQAQGLSVRFLHNLSREALVSWYLKAKYYWHAAGFEIDQETYPEKVEHFGISLVEAMAAGAIPLAHAKGGPAEILQTLPASLWRTQDEAVTQMQSWWSDPQAEAQLRRQAQQLTLRFGRKRFESTLWKMVKGNAHE